MAKSIEVWSQVKGKDNLKRWEKVKSMALVLGSDPLDLLRKLIQADPEHGFMVATNDNAVTKAPEHFCGSSNLDYEETVVLNAILFETTRYQGFGKGHSRREFGTLRDALTDAKGDFRALVYAHAASGRYVCLSRANWEWLLALVSVFGK